MTAFPNQLPLFDGLFQICYVVLDLDAGMRTLAEKHGISRFRIKRDVASLPGMPKMQIHEAHVFIGNTQIELIQPAGGDDTLYREFCSPDKSSLRHHHFGMWAEEAHYATLRSNFAALQIPIAFEAAVPGVAAVMYADARASLGHYLEYVNMPAAVRKKYYADVPVY